MAGIAYAISLAITPVQTASGLSLGQEAAIIVTWLLNGLREVLPALVAILAASILFLATNAGLMGISRLAFSLGRYELIPPQLSRVHHRFKTPYVSISLFGILAIIMLIPGLFAADVFVDLGALYVFGSLLSFAFAHAAIIALRIKKPDLTRPFKVRWSAKFRDREIPVTAVIGFLGTLAIWLVVMYTQAVGRWVGLAWMAIGLIIYMIYRILKISSPRSG
jgi:APA family basic amino acid/polyamine antiporter